MRAQTQASSPSAAFGPTLRRVRQKQGLSIERLAEKSRVSRAMLSQIELGQSTPTVNIVWKIATALDVPFSALLGDEPKANTSVVRRAESRVLTSNKNAFTSRALFPAHGASPGELYELRFAPESREESEAHAAGTTEHIVIVEGQLIITAGERYVLEAGDAIVFEADVPHTYENVQKKEAQAMLVMTYASQFRS